MLDNNDILISVGCNKDYTTQMDCAKEHLEKVFPGICFTDVIVSPAYGMGETIPDYANMLAKGKTPMALDDLYAKLKILENEMGDTKELRKENVVMMDLDLLEYNGERHHHNDWERPYVKQLLKMLSVVLLMFFLCLRSVDALALSNDFVRETERKQDTELLGKAMEYFQSGKYHESILAFEKLQKNYRLTARFKAFLGFSYFKEMKYEEAVNNLKQGIPELTAFSPKEQSVYAYSCAESLFHLERYAEAIEYYNMALPMTDNKDKADVLYHTAFSHFKIGEYENALRDFKASIELYENNAISPDDTIRKARMAQIKNMMKWLKSNLEQ